MPDRAARARSGEFSPLPQVKAASSVFSRAVRNPGRHTNQRWQQAKVANPSPPNLKGT